MSWGALPWWVYEVQYERHQAEILGGMHQEISSGYMRALPEHVVSIQKYYMNNPSDNVLKQLGWDSLTG
jgi:hypothetical protein